MPLTDVLVSAGFGVIIMTLFACLDYRRHCPSHQKTARGPPQGPERRVRTWNNQKCWCGLIQRGLPHGFSLTL